MAEHLTDEQMIEYKNAFRAHCKDDTNPLPAAQLGMVMRSLGYYPTHDELAELLKEHDPESMGWIQQYTFYQIMAKKLKQPLVTEKDILAAFKAFDRKQNGFVSVEELRHILLEIGDKFTDEEMDEFIKHATADEDGQIFYEDFVTRMMIKHPLLHRR